LAVDTLRVAVIGCGFIGEKRAGTITGHSVVIACCDTNEAKANYLARLHSGATADTDWRSVVTRYDVDAVFVCATHDLLAPIAEAAALHGKHVLVEKPGARRAQELDAVYEASKRAGTVVRVGFNHRYHRALQRARQIFDSGVLSDL